MNNYRVKMTVIVDVVAEDTASAGMQVGDAIRHGINSLNEDSEYNFGKPCIDSVDIHVSRTCLHPNCKNGRRIDDDYCNGHSTWR